MISKILGLLFSSLLILSFAGCDVVEEDPTYSESEGSVSSPITLTLDVARSATVGTSSYYSFTADVTGDYIITASNLSVSADLDFIVYNDSEFTYTINAAIDTSTTGETLTLYGVSAGTKYYLEVENWSATSNVTFDLLIDSPSI